MIKTNTISIVFTVTAVLTSAAVIAADAERVAEEDAWALVEEPADGYRSGSFLVQPELAVSGVYDSNIFATQKDEVDDQLLVFSPDLNVKSQWQRHKLELDLGGAFGRYLSQHDEDYDDYWANLDGRYDYTDKSNIFGGLGYSHEHEDRGSPEDSQSGSEPTVFDSSRVHAGISQGLGKATLRMGGTYEQLEFTDAGLLANQDRNRDLIGAGLRLSYALHPQYTVFGQGVWDKREYDERIDDNGFMRDSNGYRADAGVQATLSNRLKGELHLGYLRQEYEDSRFSSVSAVDMGGNLNWRATPHTTLSLELDRSLEETTLAGSSGYLYTSLAGTVRHDFSPRMNFNAGVSVADADYQVVDRNDDYYTAQLGMRYYVTPGYYLGAEYRALIRDSDPQDVNDYTRHQFFLTLGTVLYPVTPSADWNMSAAED